MNYQLITFAFALFWGANFLFIPNHSVQAELNHIVINEVQISGGAGHTADDFIELFNPTDTAINLKGYRLVKRTAAGTTDTSLKSWTTDTIIPAHGFYLWANSGYSTIAVTPDAVTSESLADNNGLALRQGAADTGIIIDSLAWGTATNNFIEGAAYPDNPEPNQTLERLHPIIGNRQDSNNNSQDFIIQTAPQPQNTTSPIENIVVSTPNSTTYQPTPPPTLPQPGEVIINELVSDPTDGGEEWVELYNRTSRVIDLASWTIEDGSGAKTDLSGSLGADDSSRFMVIKSPKGILNNDGELIKLLYKDLVIDQVSYGSWDDGNISNNAPAAHDPQSLGRWPNGTDTNNDQTDFKILQASQGQTNEPLTIPNPPSDLKGGAIVFNELYPNPPLGDETEEYIELINLGDLAVDLKDWLLADDDTSYVINPQDWLSTIIEPQKIWLLGRPKTKISLANEGKEKITLSSPDSKIKISLTYQGPVTTGTAYSRNQQGDWQWTTVPTPGINNNIKPINKPPQLILYAPATAKVGELIMFDASDSIDLEGERMTFSWNFGDGNVSNVITPSHVYTTAKKYTVRLAISDATGNKTEDSKTITITDSATARVAGEMISLDGLKLNEFLPNPQGSDDNEWLELYNITSDQMPTNGWKIMINNRPYNLTNQTVPAEGYLKISKNEINFTLTNNGGKIILLSPTGEQKSNVEYGQAMEGLSFAQDYNGWSWTNTPTPAAENIILTDNLTDDYQTVTLAELKTLDNGYKTKTEGIVSAEPGLMGEKLMFLSGSGIQVILNNNNWAKIKSGDKINVSGTLSRSTAGSKLVMKKDDIIQILGSGLPPTPTAINLAEVSEENEAELITVTGRVSQSSSTYFTLDDGGESLRILLRKQSASKWPKVTIGQEATVIGFITISRGNLRLSPRYSSDIVLNPTTNNQPEIIDLSKSETTNWLGYLLLTLLAFSLGGVYLWEHYHFPAPREVIKKFLG